MNIQRHPNRHAYNWLVYETNDYFIKKHIQLYRGVLYDLGAGESPYKAFFLEHVIKYVAVDWAGSYHDTKSDLIADMNEVLPIESEAADTVVLLSVLEHLREPQSLLREAFRILKNNGQIVVQVPWQWQIHEAPYDFFRYTPYGLHNLFQKAGFIDITVEPQAGFFTMMTLKINYFSLRLIRGPRLLRTLTRWGLGLFWHLGQKLAPLLDKLDKDWALEATGYFVTARKP